MGILLYYKNSLYCTVLIRDLISVNRNRKTEGFASIFGFRKTDDLRYRFRFLIFTYDFSVKFVFKCVFRGADHKKRYKLDFFCSGLTTFDLC